MIICWIPSHVGIKSNDVVGSAAKAAGNSPVANFKVPGKDFRVYVSQYNYSFRQIYWKSATTNPLYNVKPIQSNIL